jgi:cellulose synthase (UDP-forming)
MNGASSGHVAPRTSTTRLEELHDRPEELSQGELDVRSPSMTMLVLLATLGVLLYASFLLNPANSGDLLPWLIVVVAETIMMAQVMLSLWTQLSASHDPRDFEFRTAKQNLFLPVDWEPGDTLGLSNDYQLNGRTVTVDVFITVYGEPVETVRRTARAAANMRGRHETWILDDGKSDEIRALAEELGVNYLTRPDNKGAKAGNINHALAHTEGDFYVILDADFVPTPDLLVETLPFFTDPNVAFVQTPQVYGNIHNFITRGSGYLQTVFYTLIQPGKNRFNAAFSVGTNVVYRRSAIAGIGGMYQESKSEDVWTSLLLHEKGWRSIYIPNILAIGDTPETIEAYTKQQTRWATGAYEILLQRYPLANRLLTLDQRLQYHATATFYLQGFVTFMLLLLPPIQIFLGLSPIASDLPVWQWLMYYSGFYLMQVLVAAVTIGSFRWETLLLATVSFPMYIRAFFNALLRRDRAWHVTGSTGRSNSPFNFILPQLSMLALLVVSTVVGIQHVAWTGEFTIAIIWNVINTAALTVFLVIAVREARALARGGTAAGSRRARRAASRDARPASERSAAEATLTPNALAESMPDRRAAATANSATERTNS